jgi:hypothetical protein
MDGYGLVLVERSGWMLTKDCQLAGDPVPVTVRRTSLALHLLGVTYDAQQYTVKRLGDDGAPIPLQSVYNAAFPFIPVFEANATLDDYT